MVVLEVLVGTESGLSATQISRLAARGSRPGHLLALDRLVTHGVVIAEPANRGFLYRLNRDHVLVDAIVSAANARRQIIGRLTDAVAALDPQPAHVSLFGSFARRDAGPDSDIDLLVIADDDVVSDEQWVNQLAELADRVLAWTGNRLEWLIFGTSQFAGVVRRGEPIVSSVLAEGRTLFGRGVGELMDDRTENLARPAP